MNDFKLLRATLESIVVPKPDATPNSPQGLCLDKGYDYPDVYELLDEFGLSAHVRSRPAPLQHGRIQVEAVNDEMGAAGCLELRREFDFKVAVAGADAHELPG